MTPGPAHAPAAGEGGAVGPLESLCSGRRSAGLLSRCAGLAGNRAAPDGGRGRGGRGRANRSRGAPRAGVAGGASGATGAVAARRGGEGGAAREGLQRPRARRLAANGPARAATHPARPEASPAGPTAGQKSQVRGPGHRSDGGTAANPAAVPSPTARPPVAALSPQLEESPTASSGPCRKPLTHTLNGERC